MAPQTPDSPSAPITTACLHLRAYDPADIPSIHTLERNPANARYQNWEPWTRERAEAQVRLCMQSGDDTDAEVQVLEYAVVHGGVVVGRVGARIECVSPAAAGVAEGGALDSVEDGVEDDDGVDGDRNVEKPRKHIDLWFSFLPASQGQGLASEAVAALIERLVQTARLTARKPVVEEVEDGAVDKTVDGAGNEIVNEAGDEKMELELEFEIECDPRNTGSCRLAQRLGFAQYSLTERAWEAKGEWVGSAVYRRVVGVRG